MILAIETSTPTASLALWDEQKSQLVWEDSFETRRAHNAVIFHPLQEVINSHRDEISKIVVGLGPGSYSGVRVGIAVANGLALALDCEKAGVNSLLAYGSEVSHYVVVSDARRGTYALSEVRDGKLTMDTLLLPKDQALEKLKEWQDLDIACLTAEHPVCSAIEGLHLASPKASALVHQSRGGMDQGGALEPIYLRPPFITEARKD